MPRKPPPPPVCIDCGSPAIKRRPDQQPRCAECAAIARDIANQKAAVMVTAIRALKGERNTKEAAA